MTDWLNKEHKYLPRGGITTKVYTYTPASVVPYVFNLWDQVTRHSWLQDIFL